MLQQPYDVEVGAGTMSPDTFLRVLGPKPVRVAYAQPSRRPAEEFLAFAVSVLANGRIVSSDGGCSASTGHTGQHKESCT